MYESDITLFLRQLKQERPDLDTKQRAGRDLLWDKEIDRDALRAFQAAAVAQKPYVYQSGH
jgi:hypothetical protein